MKEKFMQGIKKNKNVVVLIIFLLLFSFILANVLNGKIAKFDTFIYKIIISLKSNYLTTILKFITELGSAKILILITLICLMFIKNKKIGTSIAINLASIGLLNYLLKIIIQRPRPPLEFRMVEESSFSFPSGHSMASLAFYGLIIYLLFKNIKSKKTRNIVCTSLVLLIFLIGISRIYLGVHYASDVFAGFIFSIGYLAFYIPYILKIFEEKSK